jgi:hypothetical protein
VDIGLIDLRVPENLFNRLKGRAEKVLAQLLETSTSKRRIEVNALEK